MSKPLCAQSGCSSFCQKSVSFLPVSAVNSCPKIFALKRPNHLDIARFARLLVTAYKRFIAGLEMLLPDSVQPHGRIGAKLDAGKNAGRRLIILRNQGVPIRLARQIAVSEAAEGGQLGAVGRSLSLCSAVAAFADVLFHSACFLFGIPKVAESHLGFKPYAAQVIDMAAEHHSCHQRK